MGPCLIRIPIAIYARYLRAEKESSVLKFNCIYYIVSNIL